MHLLGEPSIALLPSVDLILVAVALLAAPLAVSSAVDSALLSAALSAEVVVLFSGGVGVVGGLNSFAQQDLGNGGDGELLLRIRSPGS